MTTQGVLDLGLPDDVYKAEVVAGRAEYGTFKDSLRAPIHRWFTYPAGFSYKGVEEAFREHGIESGMTVYEPFAGTATTNVVAKAQGVHSWGFEAHPFVAFVAQTKLFWEFDGLGLQKSIDELVVAIRSALSRGLQEEEARAAFPELVGKCYAPDKLARLWVCRLAIERLPVTPFRDLAKLALTNILRALADVETGWPYIAPDKPKSSSPDVVGAFREQLYAMAGDIAQVVRQKRGEARTQVARGDARALHSEIESGSVDFSFTSPPYLNNFDYADRTRLETYFWGESKSWSDITQNVRSQLIMSATTQALRTGFSAQSALSPELCACAPDVAAILQPKIERLGELRLVKGGKKSYDMMVAGYFNDMLLAVREAWRVLKPHAAFVLVLGDSAPYGVHIETDVLLGEIGIAAGFRSYTLENLRTRGGKWKNNPQRHTVALRESILTLIK